jgi:IMP dehydrogenase
MQANKVKKLPVLDEDGKLQGMYVWNDVKNDANKFDKFSLDQDGHFLVGAAIGVGTSELKRAEALVAVGCKLLVIDSSHGACLAVRETIAGIRSRFGNAVEIIAGNVASYESTMYLLESDTGRPDGIKVGIGPGSICTTRQVTGHGIPQITAIFESWRAVRDYGARTGFYVPLIADGGITTSGDIVKAIASGANGIMMGSAMAGAEESPGAVIEKNGRKYKTIRGMGSRSAMEERSGSRMRYFAGDSKMRENARVTNSQAQKMVPEGVEGLVECKGTTEYILSQLLGGIQSGVAHTGCNSIASFQARASFWHQSVAGLNEGRPHDIADIRH